MKTNVFSESDVWLLQAIIWAFQNNKSDIVSIIAYADAINHAVLNWDEFDNGLLKLKNNGYIFFENKKILPFSVALNLYIETLKDKHSPYEHRLALLSRINSEKNISQKKEYISPYSRQDFETAIRVYAKK